MIGKDAPNEPRALRDDRFDLHAQKSLAVALFSGVVLTPLELPNDDLVALDFSNNRRRHLRPWDGWLTDFGPAFETADEQHAIEVNALGFLGKALSLNFKDQAFLDFVLMGAVLDDCVHVLVS